MIISCGDEDKESVKGTENKQKGRRKLQKTDWKEEESSELREVLKLQHNERGACLKHVMAEGTRECENSPEAACWEREMPAAVQEIARQVRGV